MRSLFIIAFACIFAGCVTPEPDLHPFAGSPQQIHLSKESRVKGHPEGLVLPAGTYRAVGQNEHGVFYASPEYVGILVPGHSALLFSLLPPPRTPGGVSVMPQDIDGSQAVISGLWRAGVFHPTEVAQFSRPNTPITFEVVGAKNR